MPRSSLLPLLAALAPWLLAIAGPAAAAPDPLAAHRWKARVLLVLAEDGSEAKLREQRNIFRDMGRDARERDLALVVVTGTAPDAVALRRRFGVGPGFHALLIGKDGGAKLTADAPLRPDALLQLIDAMPMRRDEMGRGS